MPRAVVLFLGLVACSASATTRLDVVVTGAPAGTDQYQIAFGTHDAITAALPSLDLVIPDSAAGQPIELQVWALAAGSQIAYGTATTTAILHDTTSVDIALDLPGGCASPCTIGDIQCSGDGTITCVATAAGCSEWSPVTACPASRPECSAGVCGTTCTDECVSGTSRCVGSGEEMCGQFDSDPCLDWSPVIACSAGQTCSGSACGAPPPSCNDNNVCEPALGETAASCPHDCGSGACDNGSACDDGNGCTQDDHCADGVCTGDPVACDTPPAPICLTATTLRTYAATGTCITSNCQYGSATSTCTAAPTNGTPFCTSGACGFQCNAGYMVSGTSCVAVTAPTTQLVFITNTTYTGALGGLAGADAICQSEATSAALTGTWKAWLSDGTTSAAARLTHATVPYVTPVGVLTTVPATVANNFTGLVSGTLLAPIDTSVLGLPALILSETVAWTGTTTTGAATGNTCASWTSASATLTGQIGSVESTSSTWTNDGVALCSSAAALYCIQQ